MTDTPTTQAAAVTQADERYYIDCEFDGHNGPLLSLAMVRQDGWSIHVETTEIARDPWVVANVVPHMGSNDATTHPLVPLAGVGKQLIEFMGETPRATIIADSPVDIARFCQAISTASDGGYAPHPDVALSFEVHDVDCYPTTLPGAVQHNAWWDAMALRHRLSAAPARVDGDEIKATLEGKAKPKIGQGEYAYAKREQLPAMLRAQATDALLHEAAPHVVIDAWNIAQMAADELEAALATPQSPAGGEGAEAIVESIADMLDTAYDERDHVRHDAVAADIYGYVRDRLTLRAASPATDPDLTTAGEARVDKGASEALGELCWTTTPPAGESALREAAQFLSDRLDQLEWMDDDLQATVRDYMGHVDPAHDRLKSALGSAK